MASLQQVMAMQNHYPPHQFAQYPPMGHSFSTSAAAAAVAQIPTNGLPNQVMQRYPLAAPTAGNCVLKTFSVINGIFL